MTFDETIQQLKKLGKASTVKTYKRHGCGENVYGVSFADLHKLQKKIKTDQKLAEQLWDTSNVDARSLALMIADPNQLTFELAEKWMNTADFYLFSFTLCPLLAKTAFAKKAMQKWIKSDKEFVKATAYMLLGVLLKETSEISDEECSEYLKIIENTIHKSPNRARYAMNMALISIGSFRPSMKERALAAAKRIGKVEVDHGDTSCKTPDACSYILKASKRAKAKARC